ncbi:hypothetical protein [Desertihabitans brevis]|uniref:hypothetical protein n=1 Tax=Desertihabitans brevis TaxID=2268447 RepID=UPI00131413E0|nr:hypothetical protein [Desertihabitans brevis]
MLNLGEQGVLERGPQRHEGIGHEQRHLARDRSKTSHHDLFHSSRGHFAEADHPFGLRLVGKEQIAHLADELVGMRKRGSNAEMTIRQPLVGGVRHPAMLRGAPFLAHSAGGADGEVAVDGGSRE